MSVGEGRAVESGAMGTVDVPGYLLGGMEQGVLFAAFFDFLR
jgi:hypothetical protein